MSPEMKSALELVYREVDKRYGVGTIIKLTDPAVPQPDDAISSGSIALDCALGIGGYKKGRIIEIYGGEAAGKSSLCLHAIVNAQKLGKETLYIDAEQSLDRNYAEALGVDLSKMGFVQPDYAEQALDIAELAAKSGEVGLIVIDSVAALVPKSELEGEMGDSSIGVQARLMSKALRKLVGVCNKSGTTIIFVNQIRMKIGVMWGSPEVGSGGNALKFYASQRLDIRRISDNKSGDNIIGHKCKVKVVKNKLAPPKKEAEFDIIFGKGIDTYGELVDIASQDGIIEKSGAWYKYKGENVGHGRENTLNWLKENNEIFLQVKKEVLSNRGLD